MCLEFFSRELSWVKIVNKSISKKFNLFPSNEAQKVYLNRFYVKQIFNMAVYIASNVAMLAENPVGLNELLCYYKYKSPL